MPIHQYERFLSSDPPCPRTCSLYAYTYKYLQIYIHMCRNIYISPDRGLQNPGWLTRRIGPSRSASRRRWRTSRSCTQSPRLLKASFFGYVLFFWGAVALEVLSIYLLIYLPFLWRSSALQVLHQCVYLFVYLSISGSSFFSCSSNCPSVYLFVYLSICLSVYPSVCLSAYSSIDLSCLIFLYLVHQQRVPVRTSSMRPSSAF